MKKNLQNTLEVYAWRSVSVGLRCKAIVDRQGDPGAVARRRRGSRLSQSVRVQRTIQNIELEDEELKALYAELEERLITLSDDSGGKDNATYIDNLQPSTPNWPTACSSTSRTATARLTTGARMSLKEDEDRGHRHEERDDQSNLCRLVVSIAKKYRQRPLAARPDPGGRDRPDPRREVQLLATSSRPTRHGGSARRCSAASLPSRTIRIPVHIADREQKIGRAERELVVKLGRPATTRRSRRHREDLAEAPAGGPAGGASGDEPRQAARRRQQPWRRSRTWSRHPRRRWRK